MIREDAASTLKNKTVGDGWQALEMVLVPGGEKDSRVITTVEMAVCGKERGFQCEHHRFWTGGLVRRSLVRSLEMMEVSIGMVSRESFTEIPPTPVPLLILTPPLAPERGHPAGTGQELFVPSLITKGVGTNNSTSRS